MEQTTTKPNYTFAFIVVTALFFMWGFITVLNDILIPHLRDIFKLSYAQSVLVQFCFFGAYFIISLVYFIMSLSGVDPIQRIGYKNGLLIGLFLAGVGCSLFYVAGSVQQYWCFLTALFVLASGITILQIAANPYVTILGSPETASSRLNLSQAFNSLGTTLAPVVGGLVIFSHVGSGVDAVKVPYLGLAAAFWVLALLLKFTPLPAFASTDASGKSAEAFKHPQLRFGMLAIFFYVGGEVAIGSFIINYLGLPELGSIKKESADALLSFYWGGAMIGRFMGAIALGNMRSPALRYGLMLGAAAAAFGVLFGVTHVLKGITFSDCWPYLIFIGLNFIAMIAGRGKAASTLALFAGIVIVLLCTSVFSAGQLSMWTLLSIGLFNSIMWSNIFSLSIDGLGKDTAQGSSLLVMMIVGGALVPLLVGKLADIEAIGLQKSLLVSVICYAYLLFYGIWGYRKKTAIAATHINSSGH